MKAFEEPCFSGNIFFSDVLPHLHNNENAPNYCSPLPFKHTLSLKTSLFLNDCNSVFVHCWDILWHVIFISNAVLLRLVVCAFNSYWVIELLRVIHTHTHTHTHTHQQPRTRSHAPLHTYLCLVYTIALGCTFICLHVYNSVQQDTLTLMIF